MKNILIKIALCLICFGLGVYASQERYYDQTNEIKQLKSELNVYEGLWQLDADMFYPQLCKEVCEKEFEKMGC